MWLNFADAAGQIQRAKAIRAVGLHLMVELKSVDNRGLQRQGVQMITAAAAENVDKFWEVWRCLGGVDIVDEDGEQFA